MLSRIFVDSERRYRSKSFVVVKDDTATRPDDVPCENGDARFVRRQRGDGNKEPWCLRLLLLRISYSMHAVTVSVYCYVMFTINIYFTEKPSGDGAGHTIHQSHFGGPVNQNYSTRVWFLSSRCIHMSLKHKPLLRDYCTSTSSREESSVPIRVRVCYRTVHCTVQ